MHGHLDRGNHLESATMLDKAIRGYTTRLEGQFTSVSQFGEDTIIMIQLNSRECKWLGSQTGSNKQSKILGQAKRVLDKRIPDKKNDRPEGESSVSREVNDYS